MYKKALKLGYRFDSKFGLLTIEQLFGLPFSNLSDIIMNHKEMLDAANGAKTSLEELKDFLNVGKTFSNKTAEIDTLQTKFDILKDIFNEKKLEHLAALDALATKEHNQKIDAIIAKKRENDLNNLTIEELEALRK